MTDKKRKNPLERLMSPDPQGNVEVGEPEILKYGALEAPTLDLANRPRVHMPGGDIATVYSMGTNMDGKEYLLPMVSKDGRMMDPDQAEDEYRKTGEHMGVYDSPDASDSAGERIHLDQQNKPPHYTRDTNPDGSSWSEPAKTKAPAGVLERLMQKGSKYLSPDKAEAVARGAGQGFTRGWGDEGSTAILDGLDALPSSFRPGPKDPYGYTREYASGSRHNDTLSSLRQDDAEAKRKYPDSFGTAQMAGELPAQIAATMALPLAGLSGLAQLAPAAALAQGGLGAISGAGSATEGERLEGAANTALPHALAAFGAEALPGVAGKLKGLMGKEAPEAAQALAPRPQQVTRPSPRPAVMKRDADLPPAGSPSEIGELKIPKPPRGFEAEMADPEGSWKDIVDNSERRMAEKSKDKVATDNIKIRRREAGELPALENLNKDAAGGFEQRINRHMREMEKDTNPQPSYKSVIDAGPEDATAVESLATKPDMKTVPRVKKKKPDLGEMPGAEEPKKAEAGFLSRPRKEARPAGEELADKRPLGIQHELDLTTPDKRIDDVGYVEGPDGKDVSRSFQNERAKLADVKKRDVQAKEHFKALPDEDKKAVDYWSGMDGYEDARKAEQGLPGATDKGRDAFNRIAEHAGTDKAVHYDNPLFRGIAVPKDLISDINKSGSFKEPALASWSTDPGLGGLVAQARAGATGKTPLVVRTKGGTGMPVGNHSWEHEIIKPGGKYKAKELSFSGIKTKDAPQGTYNLKVERETAPDLGSAPEPDPSQMDLDELLK